MKHCSINKILGIGVIILALILLIQYRFVSESHLSAIESQTGETIERGQIMSTEDQYKIFEIDRTQIFMSQNTEIKLINGQENEIELQLIQGRAVINGDALVSIREVDFDIQGTASIVHYSWLDQVEIAAIENDHQITVADVAIRVVENSAFQIYTLAPYSYKQIEFNPENSSESEFYKWVNQF